ncbi:hypothetical protein X975_10485, partial [Stegodyphus mimosarum]
MERAFRIKFRFDSLSGHNIHKWYHHFENTTCVCKSKSTGRPRVYEESVERVRESFRHSLNKSIQKASRELALPR